MMAKKNKSEDKPATVTEVIRLDPVRSQMRWALANLKDFNETVGLMIALAFGDNDLNRVSMSDLVKQMPHIPNGEIDRLFKILHIRGRGKYDGQVFELLPEAFNKKGSF